jgi:transcriptional regulator with XRE-family HTH domain
MKQIIKLIGQKIRATRKTKNLSQEKLAELAGLHPTYISDIENGKVNASLSSYLVIAKALKMPLSELVALPSGKADQRIENQIAELLALLRSLNKKDQALFLSAAKGMLSGIKDKKY